MDKAAMEYRHLVVEQQAAVTELTLARPEAKNALSQALLAELLDAIARISASATVHALVITGQGNVFCAGADLKERRANPGKDAEQRRPLLAFWQAVANFPKPVIFAANGHAAGGGFELLLLGDAVIAAESMQCWLPEVQWGGIPGGWGTQLLTRMVGPVRARWIILNGHRISAQEALAMGLVTHVVPAERVRETALTVATALAQRPPTAVALTKEAVRHALAAPLSTGVEIEDRLLQLAVAAPERQDALDRFAGGHRPS